MLQRLAQRRAKNSCTLVHYAQTIRTYTLGQREKKEAGVLRWLSIDSWLIGALSIGYLLLLFLVAYWGQKLGPKKSGTSHSGKAWLYSLCLGVSCTSWAFYGIIGQAASSGQWLATIYIGTIACFALCWPMLLKMLRISKQLNITSLADFLAYRYAGASGIAALVSMIALLGTIPYIALQLRAISQSFDLVSGSYQLGGSTTAIVTLVLIGFSILFGARQVQANRQNPGLMYAIAFGSLIKLIAITAVGIFACFFLFDGLGDLIHQHRQLNLPSVENKDYSFLAQVVLGFLTIFVTPQMFHMIVIENESETQLRGARWRYPLYLIAINLFVLPIAMAGQVVFPGGAVNAETYLLSLPLYYQMPWLSILVYVGGLAAATSMVIVAAIVLSTMVTTEVFTPAMLRFAPRFQQHQTNVTGQLLTLRRLTIAGILLLALLFERLVSHQNHLASIGMLSFVLLTQFAPALISALYWRNASSVGATVGLIAGSVIWIYSLLLPTLLPDATWVQQGLFGLSGLRPLALFGVEGLDPMTHGLFFSLLVNLLCLVLISNHKRSKVPEPKGSETLTLSDQAPDVQLTLGDLHLLLQRFVGGEAANSWKAQLAGGLASHQQASAQQLEGVYKALVAVLGTASTRLVMNAAGQQHSSPLALEQVAHIVEEASQLFEFNRELLQAGVENIEQGISVVDADMRLVAWNQRYIELLDYPEGAVTAGMPIADLLALNIQRGMIDGEDSTLLVQKRIEHMRAGTRHNYHRVLPSGVVLEIRGQPMPGGGFVSTFTDITQHIEAEKALQQANENLEQKVLARTEELSKAKAEAEAANSSKTRFLAAASHDLMQPFNALSLFVDMLKRQVQGSKVAPLADNIQQSLSVVEGLLSDLVEISKLEGKQQPPQIQAFCLDEVLAPLAQEFQLLTQAQGIRLDVITTRIWVQTDKRLLRRIMQNFLSNALRYSPCQSQRPARIVLGARRRGDQVEVQVWDNGPGIPADKQSLIFKEFERLESHGDTPGLGLGLAICERISRILNTPLTLTSSQGKGAMFGVRLEWVVPQPQTQPSRPSKDTGAANLAGLNVLVLDNDEMQLTALEGHLREWGCEVYCASHRQQVMTLNRPVDMIIADFHLDEGDTGVAVIQDWFALRGESCAAIICSADPSENVRQLCSDANVSFIRKPVKARALKRLMIQRLEAYSVA